MALAPPCSRLCPMPDAAPPHDFFVSYNSADKAWAEWIAWILEDAGHSVIYQGWDFRPGGNFILDMQRATGCDRTIAVLSEDYLNATYTQPEWAAALKQDAESIERKLIPIRVKPCQPQGLLAPIVYVDLVGKSQDEAREAVLNALPDRLKPAKEPGFPGLEDKAFPAEPTLSTQDLSRSHAKGAMSNPFLPLSGAVENPAQFFNGEPTLSRIFELLNSGSSVALIGDRNLGKSSILRAVHRQAPERLHRPRQTVLINLTRIYSEDDFYHALCEAIGVPPCNGRELDRILSPKRLLLLLDEVERISQDDFSRRVREQLRGLAEGSDAPLKLVIAASTPLARLFPDSHAEGMVSPFEDVCIEEYLHPWSPEVMRAFIRDRLAATPVTFSDNEITHCLTTSDGKPKQLMRLCNDCFRTKLP